MNYPPPTHTPTHTHSHTHTPTHTHTHRSHRRNYENSSNSYYNRKPEALSPVPEFAIRSIDGPAHNQWGSAGRRNASDDYPPHGLSGGGGPNTRSMENIPHGSPSTRRRRNYEQTQIGVGGVVTNSRPGYRYVLHVAMYLEYSINGLVMTYWLLECGFVILLINSFVSACFFVFKYTNDSLIVHVPHNKLIYCSLRI